MIDLLTQIEAAIDAHEGLTRDTFGNGVTNNAELAFTKFGWSARCYVRGLRAKGRGARQLIMIGGNGDTPEQAVANCIESLDTWSTVLNG